MRIWEYPILKYTVLICKGYAKHVIITSNTLLPSTLSQSADKSFNGLFSTGYMPVGPCIDAKYQNAMVYGGKFFKETTASKVKQDLQDSPFASSYVIEINRNCFLDGQPSWNNDDNTTYKPGMLQFMNQFIKFEDKHSRHQDLHNSSPIFGSAGVFLRPNKDHKKYFPAWSHDQILFGVQRETFAGEELFVNYHWTPENWASVGGLLKHSQLKAISSKLFWRETAVRYSYDIVNLRKNDALNKSLYSNFFSKY